MFKAIEIGVVWRIKAELSGVTFYSAAEYDTKEEAENEIERIKAALREYIANHK